MSSPQHRKLLRPWPARLWPFLLIFGFATALLYRMTLFGEALYWGDLFLYFQPLAEQVQTAIRHGQIPLWNPYVLCGQPLVGNPQASVIYPSTLLLPFTSAWTYFSADYLLHITFAGLGTYLFVRRLCGDRLSGVLAAFTFMGSGFLMARLQFPTMVQAAAYLPWLFVLADRLVERPGVGYGCLLAVAVGLEVLAGHAQLAYMSFGAAILYFLGRLYQTRRHHPVRAWKAFGWGALALVLGIVSTGAQVLPMAQLFGLSTREHLSWSQANRFVLRPTELIHFLAPYWHGNPARGDFWGEGNLWESCIYVGILPLLLSAYAIYRRIHRRAVWFFGALAVASLWLALGKFAGIFWVAFYTVPGLASFHDPARFTFLTSFALAVLAAYGLRALRDHGWQDRFRASLVAIAAVNLWAFSAHINPTIARSSVDSAFHYRPRFLASAPRKGEGRIFSAQRDRVWLRFLNYADYGPDSARYTHELTDTVSPNLGMRFGVEEASGYEPVPVRSVTEVDALVRAALEQKSPNLGTLLSLFNATSVLLPEMTRYRHPAFDDLPARGTTVLALRDSGPRAWLVRRTVRVDGSRRALAAISAVDFDPRALAVVSGAQGLAGGYAGGEDSAAPTEEVEGVLASYVADAGPQPAYLVISQTWYPGWHASVDGRRAAIERANHAFMGIPLGPGPHHIELRYRPAAFRIGLYLTLGSLWLIGSGLAFGAIHRKANRTTKSDGRVTARGKVPA